VRRDCLRWRSFQFYVVGSLRPERRSFNRRLRPTSHAVSVLGVSKFTFCAVPFCRQTPITLKALRAKDYSENPQTLGQHLKKRRKDLGLLLREAAERLGVSTDTVVNWEKDKTTPEAAQFSPVVARAPSPPAMAKTNRSRGQSKVGGSSLPSCTAMRPEVPAPA
jgi:DNA-binding XRE family transcriptional regulator